MNYIKRKRYPMFWTKKQLKQLIFLWETESLASIAKKMNFSITKVRAMAFTLRKAGFPLERKKKDGYVQPMLKELAKEMNITLVNYVPRKCKRKE